jgi:hypothetical protein
MPRLVVNYSFRGNLQCHTRCKLGELVSTSYYLSCSKYLYQLCHIQVLSIILIFTVPSP